jgi:hypothetical protein
LFWEDVALEYNGYNEEKKSYGVLVVSLAYDKKIFNKKSVDPSLKEGQPKTWDALPNMYLLVQKDYKKKLNDLKLQGIMRVTSMTSAMEGSMHITCMLGLNYATQTFWRL